ncbi:MAG: sulfate adenylyltransferase subunit CysD [Myxococcota bacterium]|nr:sulfate adenylyltransferase subunit CysD [Myxococcota bacterium]
MSQEFQRFENPLDELEAESIYIMREAVAQAQRPVLLFSGGKDSICMLRLAEKAVRPGALPFPLLHIDTGHNFPELIEFRDRRVKELGAELIVRTVDEAIASGLVRDPGNGSRNRLQIPVLLSAMEEFEFDLAFGGARRDEEKSRAKERVFSFRDAFGQWDPKNQRPELWRLFNARVNPQEQIRAFPLSEWTELDVWNYIGREQIAVPSIYFSHVRRVVRRRGQWLPVSELVQPRANEEVKTTQVRVRTIGDISCTGCIESNATTIEDILDEVSTARDTERGGRADDRVSETAMEDRKRLGYF